MERLGNLIFRLRGALVAILAVYGVIYAQPTGEGLAYGLAIAVTGEGLRIWAIGYSGEPTRGETLDAPQLITAGPYAFVRNPLYVGNLLNSLGVLMAAFYPWDIPRILGLWSLVAALYVFLGSHEEKFLAGLFGAEYAEYQRRVPAWVPNGHEFGKPTGAFCVRRSWQFERTSLMWWCLIWLVMAAKGWLYGA
ncbi:isoprenylcysteine carboxylmethyltransferase family protein [bacterium]|nr:isoprenylcysteine carboxylmethyltransferase family protein [bacterium]